MKATCNPATYTLEFTEVEFGVLHEVLGRTSNSDWEKARLLASERELMYAMYCAMDEVFGDE